MDYAAAELGIDRFELRRRNFIKAARDAVQDRFRHGLRLRRFPRPVQEALDARRRQRLQAAQAREQARRQTARAWASPVMSKPRRR